ncbi:hypothetical protein GCK72_006943 [Caenorhabditis remanei]|uniref:C-type lectin domain-containing protein n=1 Tax=Caenorhabditis remanei TaxID=31234 RepID=A0A6A5HHM3_CAERE|nr:hypothetical protein GCK72_006943 [Caenorhabditis remanei]KAF1766985.1 hypothetical protein GCK72_006943 [Caenorhabditis remanei]
MVLFQGNVDSNKNCTDMKTNNATSCIALCIRNESCLLTLMTEESCFHCNYGKVNWITRHDNNHYIGLKVLYDDKQMTQAQGKQNCRNVSAQLSGLESMNETRFVAKNAEVEMRADNTLRGKSDHNGWAVWIDGERRPGCTEQAVINSTAECQGVKGFNFTDTTLTAKLGYDWSENEPNGYEDKQDCVVMMLHTNSTEKRNRKLDDTSCTDSKSFLKRGVLCGMMAK